MIEATYHGIVVRSHCLSKTLLGSLIQEKKSTRARSIAFSAQNKQQAPGSEISLIVLSLDLINSIVLSKGILHSKSVSLLLNQNH